MREEQTELMRYYNQHILDKFINWYIETNSIDLTTYEIHKENFHSYDAIIQIEAKNKIKSSNVLSFSLREDLILVNWETNRSNHRLDGFAYEKYVIYNVYDASDTDKVKVVFFAGSLVYNGMIATDDVYPSYGEYILLDEEQINDLMIKKFYLFKDNVRTIIIENQTKVLELETAMKEKPLYLRVP